MEGDVFISSVSSLLFLFIFLSCPFHLLDHLFSPFLWEMTQNNPLGEGVVSLTSPGRPTDIDLQLGKACYPCSR